MLNFTRFRLVVEFSIELVKEKLEASKCRTNKGLFHQVLVTFIKFRHQEEGDL